MKATVEITGKKAVKVLGVTCLATGVVALSAVIASGAAVGAVAEGFRSAKNIARKVWKKEETIEDSAIEEKVVGENATEDT